MKRDKVCPILRNEFWNMFIFYIVGFVVDSKEIALK